MARTFEVAIIGGGVGGLCLAHGLRGCGIPVTVHERDRTSTDQLAGYRVRINPEGVRALHACLPSQGWQRFLDCSSASRSGHGFLTEQLKRLLIIGCDEGPGPSESANGHYSASRTGLRGSLLSGLEDITYFRRTFNRYERKPDGRITCFFEDSSTTTADLVVGADGANSRVRQQYLPHAERVDTGMISVAGRLPYSSSELVGSMPEPLLARPNSVIAPRGCGMFLAPHDLGGSRQASATESYLMWAYGAGRGRYPSGVDLADLNGIELRELVTENIQTWHPALRELVSGTDPATITSIPIRTAVPVPPWQTTNVTLLGDAIHSMTPLRGVGANIALRDAALLTHHLCAAACGGDLLSAVRSYESEMVGYGFRAVRDSWTAARRFTSENAIERFAFKTALRMANVMPTLRQAFAKHT